MPTKKETKKAAAAVAAATGPGPVPHCVWSNNNVACTNTWFCLSKEILGQLDASFDQAETLKMSQLAFWNDLAPANREIEAGSIADMLTKLFTNMLGAAYEPGHNFATASLALTGILTDPDRTVCELAAVVDEQHRFLNERP